MKDIDTNNPFVTAKNSCTKRENISLRITLLRSSPIFVRQTRKTGNKAKEKERHYLIIEILLS